MKRKEGLRRRPPAEQQGGTGLVTGADPKLLPPPAGTHHAEPALGQRDELLVARSADVEADGQQPLQSRHDEGCLHGVAVSLALHLLPLLVRHRRLWGQDGVRDLRPPPPRPASLSYVAEVYPPHSLQVPIFEDPTVCTFSISCLASLLT